ncbi:ATP-binding protein [Lysobacter auxotrophicus]|uniref:histidine kinase n=1 Tax=Lysobacter auxotrophicus TaxID=2992573 RepID=A0ABM8DI34_9GAMM|nr:ATP-binding protein [Lysobacter auxotrophicus]BDU18306.1 ATP-binding protein [Lysobacter auxotrophicus]
MNTRGLPIFARTFLVLLAALAVAYGIGIALLALREPPPAVRLSEVVALLSTRMPSGNPLLAVSESDEAPQPEHGFLSPPPLRTLLAQWLDVPEDRVRFFVAGPNMLPPFRRIVVAPGVPLARADAMDPAVLVDFIVPPAAAQAPVLPEPARVEPSRQRQAVRVGEPQRVGGPPIVHDRGWRADSHLPFAFVAALRQPDGRWRRVERMDHGVGIGRAFAMMFAMGLVALLPLAWWFSSALAGPIRRFAAAADHMGQDAHAPPVPLEGPAEIQRAAASFNAMQARINRLVRERTQMVAAIAHDLRTPLARLSFRLDGLPAEAREKATADIAEMSQMIEAALEFIREQHRERVRERLDLRLLVESVVDEQADMGHAVALAPGASAPLRGDPLALRRMVANLVDNAIKYGRAARLSLHPEADGYRLCIDDDGPGVDMTRSEQLFMPFVRGESSRNRETGGIGLGLATARGVVLAHGGDIALANRDEGGLRVTVTLPHEVG